MLLVAAALTSCKNKKNTPDVSDIKIDLQVLRHEQDFFNADTSNLVQVLDSLQNKYGGFNRDFIYGIVGIEPFEDSVISKLPRFITDYKSVYNESKKTLTNIDEEVKIIKHGLQLTKHYFPKYNLPVKLMTCIGPINSESAFIGVDYIGIGLQMYMGKGYSLYNSEMMQRDYPAYITRRFEKQYIPVNAIKTIVEDINTNDYENSIVGKSLVEQMIDAGRKLYVLDKLLPDVADTLKTGYTTAQLQGSYDNEASIWSFFVQNDLLFSTDPNIIKDYMNDAPFTQALGEASPGFIGQFTGWQIVKKWMEKNDKKALDELLKTSPKQIFEEAKYKP